MKLISHIVFQIFILLSVLCSQSDYEEWLKKDQQAFSEYKASVTAEYEKYEQEDKEAFEQFKREVKEKWEEFKSPNKKVYVEYDNNKESRTSIDFEEGTVTVEVLVEEDRSTEKNIIDVVLATEKLQKAVENIVKTDGEDDKPLLQNQLESTKKEEVTPENISEISKELIKEKNITMETDHEGTDGHKRKKYMVVIPLKANHLSERAKRYEKMVLKYSKQFDVEPHIVFAIIETESAFNPKAKSHIPAYGLMQLVPSSGAKDAYLYIQANARDAYSYINQEDKYLSKRYLYKPEKNIELGCAYLAKIRHVYYMDIKDDEKAYICAIPAYNTGIGNVSKTLSGTTKLKPAAKVANNMSSKKLYGKLTRELQYKEARDYLERVWERKDKYKI